ncbi:sugar transferase [Halobacillus litoralis]|uniref:Sugar transferase n=1 Tax=Halobacillus litoralis TaxID=45668 RepID=A0A845F702_9BACI|nr:sugar transferase [Halobacillus litoralis]MYL69903.1 sugar transferase [Halobacillus litoralis]
MKRILDLLISLILIILLVFIFLLVSLIVRVKMGSPILFKQKRIGLDGIPFELYKFRTMNNRRDDSGNLLSDKQRLTSTGLFLRRYSLDEIPQLLNVIKGEMSIVGPRPLLLEYLPLYNDEQILRNLVRPGITGWAQINGRNAISWEEKFKLDVWYVNNQTLFLDFKILFITFFKVIKREGIHQDSHATMEKFKGTRGVM